MSADDGVIRIASTTGTEQAWRLHAQARVRRLLCDPPPPVDVTSQQDSATEHWDADSFYALLEEAGLDYGPYFQVLHDVYLGPGQVLARYKSGVDQQGYEAHPAILDGAIHAGVPLLEGRSFLPGAIDRVRLWRQPSSSGFVHVRQRSRTRREACWDILVGDDDGAVAAELLGCRMRRAGADQAPPARYVTVLKAAARQEEAAAPSPLPGPSDLVTAAGKAIHDVVAKWDQPAYERLQQMAKKATAHVARAGIGDMLPGREEFTTDDLLAAGMLPKYLRMWQVVAPLCEQHGLLERRGDGRWRTTGRSTTPIAEFAQSVLLDLPQHGAEMLMHGRMATNWADLRLRPLRPVGAPVRRRRVRHRRTLLRRRSDRPRPESAGSVGAPGHGRRVARRSSVAGARGRGRHGRHDCHAPARPSAGAGPVRLHRRRPRPSSSPPRPGSRGFPSSTTAVSTSIATSRSRGSTTARSM